MALWRRNGFDFDEFEKSVSSLFSDFRQTNNQQSGLALVAPHFDVRENEREFVVHAELAGVKKEDIQIDFRQAFCRLKVKRKKKKNKKMKSIMLLKEDLAHLKGK